MGDTFFPVVYSVLASAKTADDEELEVVCCLKMPSNDNIFFFLHKGTTITEKYQRFIY